MPEGVAAIIYGALLSSKSFQETCTSSRSTVRLVLDGMRTGPVNGKYVSKLRNNASRPRIRNSSSFPNGLILSQRHVEHSSNLSGSLASIFISRSYPFLSRSHQLGRRLTLPSHSNAREVGTEHTTPVSEQNSRVIPLHLDTTSSFAPTTAIMRIQECVRNPPSDIKDALQVWHALEQTDGGPTSRWIPKASVNHYYLIRFAKLLVQRSRASWQEPSPYPTEIADVIDSILLEIRRRSRRPRRVEEYFLWHSKILRRDYTYVIPKLLAAINESGKREDVKEGSAKQLRVLTDLFLNCFHNFGLEASLDTLLPFCKLVHVHLESKEDRFTGLLQVEAQRLRESLLGAFSTVQDPLVWISTILKSSQAQELAMWIFFLSYGGRGDADRSWRLFEHLQARKVVVPYGIHLRLLRIFVVQRAFQCAEGINESLQTHYNEQVTDPDKRHVDEIHVNLHLASIQGDFSKTQELYDLLLAKGHFIDRGIHRHLMHAYAVAEDAEHVEHLFAKFFDNSHRSPPSVRDYREVIYAHVRVKNMTAVNRWLEEMIKRGVYPNLSIYNMVLSVLSHQLDAEAAVSLLSKMYEQDIRPDKYSFTTVLSAYAARRDPVGAEKVYERAIKEGIEPDEVMTMALMNAHIEAGSWRGAIQVFDYLNVGRIRNSRYLGQLYNTLLKAYVLIGAPFSVVYKIFRRFEKSNLLPTLRSYTLLIQSACDSGRMDIARNLFLELDTQPTYGRLKSHVDAYLMTIIMAGFLRIRDIEKAKLVYEDMLSRDLRPGAVTFGLIIRSFAGRGTAESLKLAEDFMYGVLEVEGPRKAFLNERRGGTHRALESLISPLMNIYGRDLDIDNVRRLYDYMISVCGDPTMVLLNILMDAYRRTGNVAGVEKMWPDAVAIAKRLTQRDLLDSLPVLKNDDVPSIDRAPEMISYQANILCISLSIYIETLSQAGKHLDIPKVWKEVRELGFAFDAHNWNHLTIALVRAGEVERAFEIVERVILPYQKQRGDIERDRMKTPSSPLFFIKSSAVDKVIEHELQPDESSKDDEDDEKRQWVGPASKSRRIESLRRATIQHKKKFPLTDLNESDDLAQPLHELQQMAAHLQGWRVHVRTLKTLRTVLQSLSTGRLIRATKDFRTFSSEDGTIDTAERLIQQQMANDNGMNFDRQEAERLAAMELTEKLLAHYPRAVMWVEHFFARHEQQVRTKRK